MRDYYPLYVGGLPESTALARAVVRDVYSGQPATQVARADAEVVERAIMAACAAAPAMAALSRFRRQEILRHCAQAFQARSEELIQTLCVEVGKPLRDARIEVERLIDTFLHAADCCIEAVGEVLSLDVMPRALGYRGMVKRVPVGPVLLIAPFNFPLNLVAHKVAPAIAAGCPFILKPASLTPVSALLMAEILADAGLPPGAFSVLPCDREVAESLVTDQRLRLLSFTGSAEVGWAIKARAGKKKVILELGGNAACIVAASAELAQVVPRLLQGIFAQAGQSCISVQRIYVHVSLYAQLRAALVEGARHLKVAPPEQETTVLGPMITVQAAERLQSWVDEAILAGGVLLCGGGHEGNRMQASLLENVPEHCKLVAEEAFGPVAVLASYDNFEEVLNTVNRSRYGLQAGVFTSRLDEAMLAWDRLEVGGVVVGDIPSWRADAMPYGGVKDSGIGREGLRYAIEEMTESRLLIIHG